MDRITAARFNSTPRPSASPGTGEGPRPQEARPQEARPQEARAEEARHDIHVISHVDATEQLIEPYATADLHDFQQATASGRLTADVSIDREAHPVRKAGIAALDAMAVAAPAVAGRLAASLTSSPVLHVVAWAVAGLGTLLMAGRLVDAIHHLDSARQDVAGPEKVWSGHQEMHMEQGQRQVESSSPASNNKAAAITDFLAEKMKAYPAGHTVVHMCGHGLMYHAVAGLPGEDFTDVLSEATRKAGRPVDVLWLESCLSSNLETLSAIRNCARYAIVSEETVGVGTVGRMLEKTMGDKLPENVTARDLADRLVQGAFGDPSVETLAVIDMQRLPDLEKAVDRLGEDLLGEIATGHVKGLLQALSETPLFPNGSGESQMLQVGDLASFARKVEKAWGPDGTEASSSGSQQVLEDARGVQEALDQAVVRLTRSAAYDTVGGVSIQLPGVKRLLFEKLVAREQPEDRLTPYDQASSPEHWRDLVDTLTGLEGLAMAVKKGLASLPPEA